METQLQPDVYWVGAYDPDLSVFDIEMPTNGTSYNSYLVMGEEVALIDTVKEPFVEDFLAHIRAITPLSAIRYVVVNHTEPDHSGSLSRLLSEVPHATVVCTRTARTFLKAQLNRDFDCLLAEDAKRLDLGKGLTLEFIKTPFLHWPDTMVTYLPAREMLFSCDVFGAHCCEPGKLYDDELANHLPAARTYYDAIVSPFDAHVRKALPVVKALSLKLICPSHGPILRSSLETMIGCYELWSQEKLSSEHLQATVLFASAYGNTEQLAQVLSRELERQGIAVKVIRAEHGFDVSAAVEAIHASHAVLVGSPTVTADAVGSIWEVMGKVNAVKLKGRPAMVFGSYGWSGEAIPHLTQRLTALGMRVFPEPLQVQFSPTESDLESARELGARFAEQLKQKFAPPVAALA